MSALEAAVRAAVAADRLAQLRSWLDASPGWALVDGASRYQFQGTAWWCQCFYVYGESKVTIWHGFQRRRTLHATIVERGAPDAEPMLAQFVARTDRLLRGDG